MWRSLKIPVSILCEQSKWETVNRTSQGRCSLTLVSLPSTCSPAVPSVKAYTSQRCCLPQWVTQNSTWHQFLCGRHKCPNSKHIFSWQKPRIGVGNGFSTPWVRKLKLWFGTSIISGAFFLFQSTLLCFSVNGVFKEGKNLESWTYLWFLVSQLSSYSFSSLTFLFYPNHLGLILPLTCLWYSVTKTWGPEQYRWKSQTGVHFHLCVYSVGLVKLQYLRTIFFLFCQTRFIINNLAQWCFRNWNNFR